MNKFFKKTKGMISVFLSLVLLPFLALACIFVDMARVELSKGVALSAADVTLNTILTQYDSDLVEYYGLMGANATAASALISSTSDYMTECMVSSGLTKDGAQIALSQIWGTVTGTNTVQDLLQTSLSGEDGVTVTAVGSLAEPQIVKTQIVEFMKYRGPIELVESVISALKDDDTAEKALENAEKESKLLDERQAFYTIENSLVNNLLELQTLIKDYEALEYATDDTLKNDIANTSSLNNFESQVQPYHNQFYKNMYLSQKSDYTGIIDMFDPEAYSINLNPTPCTTYSSNNHSGIPEVKKAVTNLATCMESFLDAKSNLETAWNNSSTYQDGYNNIQYWLYLTLGSGSGGAGIKNLYEKYVTAANKAIVAYDAAVNAVNFFETDSLADVVQDLFNSDLTLYKGTYPKINIAVPDSSKTTYTIEETWDGLKEQYSGLGLLSTTGNTIPNNSESVYNKIRTAYNSSVADNVESNTSLMRGTFTLESGESTYFTAFNTNICQPLKSVYDKAAAAEKAAKAIVDKANEIEELVPAYQNAFTAWYNAAKTAAEADSELATGSHSDNDKSGENGYTGDWEIVQAIDSGRKNGTYTYPKDCTENTKASIKQSVDLLRNVTKDDFSSFVTRYNNIDELFNAVMEGASAPTYEGVALHSLYRESDSEFKKAVKKAIADYINSNNLPAVTVTLSDSTLTERCNNCYSFDGVTGFDHFNWGSSGEVITRQSSDSKVITGYNIDANHMPTVKGKDNTPTTYTWVTEYEFIEPAVTDPTINKNNAEDKEGEINEKDPSSSADTSGNSTSSNEISGQESLPSAGTSGSNIATGEPSKETDDSTSFLEKLDIANLLSCGRDILYVEEYVMNMFSYDTSLNEGMYSLLSDNQKKNLSPTTESTYYTEDLKKQWLESDDNKSLTNQLINESNNWSYGNEVEYILYGGKNATNKTAAYGSIYLLRYALDLAPVFREWYDDPAVESVAASLNAFLFIPIPLTKTLICLALTAGEAAMDLQYLKLGVSVPFYKTANCKLYVSYESIFGSGDTKPQNNESKALCLSYSAYLRLFLIVGLIGSDSSNKIYARIADVVQVNMQKSHNVSSFTMKGATTYYTLSANLEVKPMMTAFTGLDAGLEDMFNATGWRTYSLKLTRGYS